MTVLLAYLSRYARKTAGHIFIGRRSAIAGEALLGRLHPIDVVEDQR
jgi:hypothetical protein